MCPRNSPERVFDRLDRFDPTKGSLCTWLFSIAHNVAVSFLRKRNRRLESLDAMDEDEAPTCAGPEELHDARERRTRLRRCVADLDPRERHALIGRHVRRLSWRKLAAEMGCCIRSAHNWLARAVKKLQKEL
jgi:RNA polymerase sigma-70 factor (ECF subfamily)